MTPLTLVALCAIGTDPQPYPYPDHPPLTPPYVAEKRLPPMIRPVERIKAKVAELALPGRGKPFPPGSFLWQPSYEVDYELRGPTRPYTPQPGDIVMSTDTSAFWIMMHRLAGTSHPTHSMVVFEMPDGQMGIIEAGPHDTLKCRVLEALPHMYTYEAEGRVWVRRRACPLTPEQSARLTEFALSCDGKEFAVGRLALQLTPFRPRGPIRTAFCGKPNGMNRSGYYCSELLVEAFVYAGLMDPRTARPAATYPRDVHLDRSPNCYLNKHLKLFPAWDPPARWTSTTCPPPDNPRRQVGGR
jgi:hypothetical protein